MQSDQRNYPPHLTDNGYQQDDHYGQPLPNCMQQPPMYNRPPPPFNQPPPNIHLQPPRK